MIFSKVYKKAAIETSYQVKNKLKAEDLNLKADADLVSRKVKKHNIADQNQFKAPGMQFFI